MRNNERLSGVGGRSKAVNRVRVPFLLAMALVLAFVVTGSAAQTRDCLYSSNDDVWIDPVWVDPDDGEPKRVDVFFARVTPGWWYTGWIFTDDPDDNLDLYVFRRRDVVVLGEYPNYTVIADDDDAVCSATSCSGRESCDFFASESKYVFIVVLPYSLECVLPYSLECGEACYTVGVD